MSISSFVRTLGRSAMATPARIIAGCNIIICGFFLVAAIIAGLLPAATKFHLYGSPIPIFIAAIAVCSALFFLAEVKISSRLRKRYGLIVGLVLAVNFIVLAIVAHALESHGYTWDSELVFNQAVNFATKGSIDDSFINYLVASPNNIALLSGLGGLFKLLNGWGIKDFLTIGVMLNVILLFASEVLTFFVVKMLYGRRIALFALGFCFIFISMSMYVEIVYTDTLTIVFPILLLFLALRFVRAQSLLSRAAFAVVLGFTTILGYNVKPTVMIAGAVISGVAIAAVLARQYKIGFKGESRYRLGTAALCVVLFVAGAAGSFYGFRAYVDKLGILPYPVAEANENSYPIYHFLNIGMKYRVYSGIPYYGGYNDPTAVYVASLPTEQQKVDYSKTQIGKQLAAYGLFGYANFLVHKSNWILSDATFYAYGEGSNANVVFVHQDGISQWLRTFMYIGGAWYILFGNILQVFWIALLLLIGAQFVIMLYSKPSRQNLYVLLPRLMLAGIITFLLFFEGRSRYIFLYLPIFIVSALYILSWYRDYGNPPKRNSVTAAAKP